MLNGGLCWKLHSFSIWRCSWSAATGLGDPCGSLPVWVILWHSLIFIKFGPGHEDSVTPVTSSWCWLYCVIDWVWGHISNMSLWILGCNKWGFAACVSEYLSPVSIRFLFFVVEHRRKYRLDSVKRVMSHSNIPNKKTVGALHLFNIIRSTKKRKRHKQSPSIKTNTLIGTSLSQHSNCFGGREILKLAEYILNEGFKIIYQQITLVGGETYHH